MSINDTDLIFYRDEGNVYSGGFLVDSMLMKGGKNLMETIPLQDDGSLFGKNLVVPPFWFLSRGGAKSELFDQEKEKEKEKKKEKESELLEEDLHDKLLKLLQVHGKKNGVTKKRTAKKENKKTRKNIQ